MKDVSVIVPVYHVEKFIERCLQSILNQSYQHFEIICVDDCGQDGSIGIIEKIQTQFPEKIKILYGERNMGLGAARDRGLKAAKGDYVAFIDSDDYLKEDYLMTYVQAAQRSGADMVAGGYIRDEQGVYKEFPVDVKDDTFVWMNVSSCTKLFKRSFLQENEISFLGVRRYEDEGFIYRCMLCEPVVQLIPYMGYYYYMNVSSITRSASVDRTKIFMDYVETVRQMTEDLPHGGEQKELLAYCLVSGLIANLLYNGQGIGRKRMKPLYGKYRELVEKIDGNICRNRYTSLKYLKSEPQKKRYATWLVLKMRAVKLEWLVFWAASML